MYKLIPYSDDLDLSEFYATAKERGFDNNANKHMLVETIAKEDQWQVWMLLYNNKIVGSTAAHSFPEMGPNSYRIAVRTCAFTDMMHITRARTRQGVVEHQHVSPQYFMTAGTLAKRTTSLLLLMVTPQAHKGVYTELGHLYYKEKALYQKNVIYIIGVLTKQYGVLM